MASLIHLVHVGELCLEARSFGASRESETGSWICRCVRAYAYAWKGGLILVLVRPSPSISSKH